MQAKGADSPRLDAEVLLSEAMQCQRIELYARFDEAPGDDIKATFRDFVRRRAEGTPVAYLVGHREFYSIDFRVTPDVLIPRPETEFLVVAALDKAAANGGDRRLISIVDVGTGSGCVAVSLAKHLPDCRVTAVDISPTALAVAKENARRHGLADRIEFVHGDLLAEVSARQPFDLVISNPPYVTEDEWAALPRDVRDYEPRGALVAGPRGTEAIERLLPQAADHLRPGGWLLIEVGPAIHAAACDLVSADARFELGPTIKDLARLPRIIQAGRR